MARRKDKDNNFLKDELGKKIKKAIGEDILKEIVEIGVQLLMEMERDDYIGIESYARGGIRRTYRNGYKSRRLNTRVGEINLLVPQTRDCNFYPSILERYQRSEKALILSLAEAYLQGVSTRKMKKITEYILGKEISSMTVSRYSEILDKELERWRLRDLEEEYPYVIVDARYDKCRIEGEVIDMSVHIAIGINNEGYRRFLGIDVSWGENEGSWDDFFKGLKQRGLKGVRLIVSDAHVGIRKAIKKYFTGTSWQRCQRHFMQNVIDKLPVRYKSKIEHELKEVWMSDSWEEAKNKLDSMAARWEGKFSQISDFLSEEGLDTLTVYRVCPQAHRNRLRTNNVIERLNEEFKRRGRVVRIFPNPKSCIRLYGSIAKEWDEDWLTGKKYMEMEPLWQWIKETSQRFEELAPQTSDETTDLKILNVV